MVRRWSFFDIFVHAILVAAAMVIVLPILYIVLSSMVPYEDVIRSSGIVIVPSRIDLSAYQIFLEQNYIADSYRVTIFITLVGTLINILMTSLMAYPLSRKDLPFNKLFMLFVTIPLFIQGGLIPTYLVVRSTGLLNSVWAMIVPTTILVYNLLVMRTFFGTIDQAYYEAAYMDGAGEFFIFSRIVLPLSKPVLATMVLFYGVGHWNELFAAIFYITDPHKHPLQVVLRSMINQAENLTGDVDARAVSSTLKNAAVVLTAAPITLVYPFLQRYFTKGVMLGGVKG